MKEIAQLNMKTPSPHTISGVEERMTKLTVENSSETFAKNEVAPPQPLSLLVNSDNHLADSDMSEENMSTPLGSPSLESIEISSLFLYFTHALREGRSRSKLCASVGNCMNDISQIEETFGKHILKVMS